MRVYTFRIFRFVKPENEGDLDHREIATYDGLETPPWVPPQGSYFRFRDPSPPGRPTDHNEVAGYVDQVVTCFYGTRTTIEIYLKDKSAQ
jgi:hypothetical protein